MHNNPYLSIIIPCYNEEVNLRLGALDKIANFLKKQKYAWEVLIVDDGSSDGSKKLVSDFCRENKHFKLIENPHQGKAATVITGMLKATGQYILFMDMDLAVPVEEVNKLLPWFSKGFAIVIGSRRSKRAGAPMTRTLMAQGFMLLRGVILGMQDIADTQCGFKAFSKAAAQNIFHKLKLYQQAHAVTGSRVTAGFDVETLFLAQKLGYKIKEVEVTWHHVDTRRVNPIRDSIEGLLALINIRMNDIQGKYN